jgi:hypothetical protein
MKTFLKFFVPFFLIFFILGLWSGRRVRLAGIDPHAEIARNLHVDLDHNPPTVEFVCGGRPVWAFDVDERAARRVAPDFAPRLSALSITERWEASYIYAVGTFGGVAELAKMSPAIGGTQTQKIFGTAAGIVSGYSLGFGLAYNSRLDCASPEVYAILTSKTAGTDCQPDIWQAVAAPKIFTYRSWTKHGIEFPASYTLWRKDLVNKVASGNDVLKSQIHNAVHSYSAAGFHAQSGALTSSELIATREAVVLVFSLYQKYPDRFQVEVEGKTYALDLLPSPRY